MEYILNEIQQVFLTGTERLVPPYIESMTFDEKFQSTHRELRKAIRLKNRMLALENAFFLGQLLDSLETSTQRFIYKRKLTVHYAVMAEHTFDIFENNPSYLHHVTSLTVQKVKKFTKSQVMLLRETISNHMDEHFNLN
jgi:hypothetical protein